MSDLPTYYRGLTVKALCTWIVSIGAAIGVLVGGATKTLSWMDARYELRAEAKDRQYRDSLIHAAESAAHDEGARRAALRDFVLDSMRTHGRAPRGRVLQAGDAR
jgi:hypothetical protein